MDRTRQLQFLEPRAEIISAFYSWTQSPSTDPADLERILDSMGLAELEHVMRNSTDTIAARLAWAEYGRRQGYINFHIYLEETEAGGVLVQYAGSAAPISGLSFAVGGGKS